jgi:hypothetical protein
MIEAAAGNHASREVVVAERSLADILPSMRAARVPYHVITDISLADGAGVDNL